MKKLKKLSKGKRAIPIVKTKKIIKRTIDYSKSIINWDKDLPKEIISGEIAGTSLGMITSEACSYLTTNPYYNIASTLISAKLGYNGFFWAMRAKDKKLKLRKEKEIKRTIKDVLKMAIITLPGAVIYPTVKGVSMDYMMKNGIDPTISAGFSSVPAILAYIPTTQLSGRVYTRLENYIFYTALYNAKRFVKGLEKSLEASIEPSVLPACNSGFYYNFL